MILTGRHVSPEEGKELGFVNDVVSHDALMNAAMDWAKQICACAPLSIRASKDVVYKSLDSASLQDAMEGKYDSVKAMVKSEDFIEVQRPLPKSVHPIGRVSSRRPDLAAGKKRGINHVESNPPRPNRPRTCRG